MHCVVCASLILVLSLYVTSVRGAMDLLFLQVSLRPTMASMKLGSSRHRPSPASSPTPEQHAGGGKERGRGESRSPIPRTRDDSSDEEGPPNRSTIGESCDCHVTVM